MSFEVEEIGSFHVGGRQVTLDGPCILLVHSQGGNFGLRTRHAFAMARTPAARHFGQHPYADDGHQCVRDCTNHCILGVQIRAEGLKASAYEPGLRQQLVGTFASGDPADLQDRNRASETDLVPTGIDRDALVYVIGEGTSEVQRNIIARAVFQAMKMMAPETLFP